MYIFDPDVEYIEQNVEDSAGIYEHIEKCGKTCYKSVPKGGETAIEFVQRMIKNKHYAMLEHGTVYLKDETFEDTKSPLLKYEDNKYSKTYIYQVPNKRSTMIYVTTNLRVLVENDCLKDLDYICEPTPFHERRFTFKITCDRAVSHELVRHRAFSFAQESQRYCNYSKDKFNNQVTFIKPAIAENDPGFLRTWEHSMAMAESTYNQLINGGYKPQDARSVLPNSTKTEVIMTGFDTDWLHFLELRYYQRTGPVNPDMLAISKLIKDLFYTERNKIESLTPVTSSIDKPITECKKDDNTPEENEVGLLAQASILFGKTQKSPARIHREILDDLHKTYVAKNADYGDSFAKLSNEYGPVYALAHMEEKLERVKTLFKTNKNNVGEKISDTLLDLANYAILTAMQFTEIDK